MRKQTGRSMLEMLGVLAIIGMLAIGGVWGIRKAFTKHNANNLIEDVRLASFIVVDEMFETVLNADGDVALNDKITPQTNYTFKAFAEENSTTTFGILAQNIPFNVCEEVRKRKVDWLEEIRPNGLDNVCKEDNEISFFFNTELGKYPELEDNTCRSDRDCPSNKPYCRDGKCFGCKPGQFKAQDGNCYSCGSAQKTTLEECHACENYIFSSSSTCISCESATQAVGLSNSIDYERGQEECAICRNRIYISDGHTSVPARYCALPCINEEEFLDASGNCRSCNNDSFCIGWNLSGNPEREIYNDLLRKCNNCPNMLNDDSVLVWCVNLDSKQNTHVFTPDHCKQYFKGKRYVAKETWVYECTLCPEKDSDAWNSLTDEQKEQCTP